MKILGLWIILSLSVILFLAACTPEPAIAPATDLSPGVTSIAQLPTTNTKAPAKEIWEVEWEKTLQAARKEGKVLIYGMSFTKAISLLAPEFRKKYGFELEIIIIERGGEMVAKIMQERRAGLFLPDIYSGGTTTFYSDIKKGGLADPMEPALILPDVLNPENWYGGALPWGDKDHMNFTFYAYPSTSLAVNSSLVKPGEIKSYNDLLNPKFKGKILMNDPTVAGTGLKGFSVVGFSLMNLDFFRQLVKQDPVIIRNQRLQVEWLAQGKYNLLLFPLTTPITEFMEAGAPIALVQPKEGTYLSTGGANIALMNRAPHPNAAKIFINWLLTRETQIQTTEIHKLQSARVDVPTVGLDPLKTRQPDIKYFIGSDTEAWLSREPEFAQAAQDIFGQMIK